MTTPSEQMIDLLAGQPVVPVLLVRRLKDAIPLARALARGGLPAIEVTLRTPVAVDAIRLVSQEVPEAIVGAGTILSARDYGRAADASSRFIVSPGTTPQLLAEARLGGLPFLPGAATPSEIMALQEEGYTAAKFFPAEQSGGAPYLKALASPLAQMRFCPTGGITPKNAESYLSLPNVICIGGSWVAPDALVGDGRWDEIEALAREASKLRRK
jgi:2-dehydro-3-deoxyphosphogluconate aldolase/(4S)-4-hydroxy-2-oxoglutarate aldolase